MSVTKFMSAAVAPDLAMLTAEDRCDRCGARAYYLFVLDGGGELTFCAHHERTHRDALEKVMVHRYDESRHLA